MLQRSHDRAFHDLSSELRDSQQWKAGELRRLHFPTDVTAFAFDPVTSLLAVGTAKGLIHIFGKPPVQVTLTTGVGVKFLLISVSTSRLASIDNNNQLCIWDLSTFGRPQFLAAARFDQINCILSSPSHSHLFLAMHTGEIKMYDLLCLRKSQYALPNLWRAYEKKTAATGVRNTSHDLTSQTSVEVVAHPRDLNLLFIAYAGGVVLSDLTRQEILRVYEYIIPPGAPGGVGYGDSDILMHRTPPVTCIAVHPTGHFFAVGHTDGSVVFWAVEDEDHPLLVKTRNEVDVNIVDADELERRLSGDNSSILKAGNCGPEPVIKLTWSGFPNSRNPRSGNTVLTVLGGLNATDPPGLIVYELPAVNPPSIQVTTSSNAPSSLHPNIRSAMRDSLCSIKTFFYSTPNIVQDYLLIPRDNPHYSGNFDPVAIILMTEQDNNSRRLEAFEFPPPAFNGTESVDERSNRQAGASDTGPDDLSNELEATLQSLQETDEPLHLRTPASLWISAMGLINGQLLALDRSSYHAIAGGSVAEVPYIQLSGGVCRVEGSKENELMLTKYQPHRILITYNRNSTIQFFDVSAQLLANLEHEFPRPLPALTIDTATVLGDPHVASLIPADPTKALRILSVEFLPQLACVVILESGELIVFREENSTVISPFYGREHPDTELIPLGHIEVGPKKRLIPHLMVAATDRGRIEASSMSGIGSLAISYSDGTMIVIDARVFKVILRRQQKKKSKHAIGLHSAVDRVVDLVWTVCRMEKDTQPRLRLLAVYVSGHTDVFSFVQDAATTIWSLAGEPAVAEAIANPLPHGNFVLSSKTGSILNADRERVSLTQYMKDSDARCLFIATGTKGARAYVDLNGPRIAKAEWSGKTGQVLNTQIIERMGSHVLLAFTDKNIALVYSLPYLEHLHDLQLPTGQSLPLTVDATGDFIAFAPHPVSGHIHEAAYGTVFDFRRVYSPPDVELIPVPPNVPSSPQPVPVGSSSLLNTWFGFGSSMSGDQLDVLLGGPQRPIPEPRPQTLEDLGETSSDGSGMAARAAAMHNDLYNRLTQAMGERGQLLEDLGERFNALEEGSRNMAAQARRLATQQAAKSWFRF
ncbi:hypothetical protein AX17_000114 [Amanita inopinata Kibby_2008]|nr:hypothetical protein AX17_000114 [Amanita inopinata Kibby_2008]